MSPEETFVKEGELLLERLFTAADLRIVGRWAMAGLGAYVTAEVRGLVIRLIVEYNTVFVVNVASPSEAMTWYHLPEVMLLLRGEAYRPGATSAGRSLAAL